MLFIIAALVAVAVYFAPTMLQKADITPPATVYNRSGETVAVENLALTNIPNGGRRKLSMV
jgi:hypothetical protein